MGAEGDGATGGGVGVGGGGVLVHWGCWSGVSPLPNEVVIYFQHIFTLLLGCCDTIFFFIIAAAFLAEGSHTSWWCGVLKLGIKESNTHTLAGGVVF